MYAVHNRKPEPGETNEILNILLHFIKINQLNIFEMSDRSNEKKYLGDIIMKEMIEKGS